MSGDISGEEAFVIVLDKLVEEGRARASDIDARRTAEQQRSEALRQLENAKADLGRTQAQLAHYTGADDAIGKLYDIVEKAIPVLASTPDSHLCSELKTAVAAAKKFIDPIPF